MRDFNISHILTDERNKGIFSIKWDYLLVYLLVANSAVPFFYIYIEFKVINFIIVGIVFLFRGKSIEKFLFLYVFLFIVMFLGQTFTFNSFAYRDFLTIIIRILIAYLTIRTVGFRFFHVFINIIYVSAIISFFFYLPSVLWPGFVGFFASKISPFLNPPFQDPLKQFFSNQIIIYNFNIWNASFRNSGPFWEPGVFSAFLIIAITINTVIKGNLFEKKNLIMTVALLTTISTAGYLALFLFTIIYFILIQKKINPYVIAFPLLAIIVTIFFEVSFLRSKINSEISNVHKYYTAGRVGNRFVSAIVDFNDFLKYPAFGKGNGQLTDQLYSRFNEHRSNGIATFLANFGLIFFIFYFSNLYLSFFRFCSLYLYSKYLVAFIFMIFIVIGFSEEYFNFPFFYSLTMLHILIPKEILSYIKWDKLKQIGEITSNKPLLNN